MTSARLVSVDAFRGLTIAAMVLVNNPGTWSAVHPPLRHAAWHGLTPTDLVFPFFLFIVGGGNAVTKAAVLAAGAFAYLERPAGETALIHAIRAARSSPNEGAPPGGNSPETLLASAGARS